MTDEFSSAVGLEAYRLLKEEIRPNKIEYSQLEEALAHALALAAERKKLVDYSQGENKELIKNANDRLEKLNIHCLPKDERDRIYAVLDIGIAIGKASNGYKGKKASSVNPKAIARAAVEESMHSHWLAWRKKPSLYNSQAKFAEGMLNMPIHQDEDGIGLTTIGNITNKWIPKWRKK